ncbi:MAG: RNA pseudouridine synthase [Geminicoccaceae bacterium]|nr:RNA pseudouridine synthase [Geminicoccaceae bacterium]
MPADTDLLARLLYRDGLVLVVDKPAGLPVHAGPKGGPNLERFLEPLRFGLPDLPHLAHRLDRDTSGCLVLGRHKKALRRLGRLFEAGRVEKTYWAVTAGRPEGEAGTIDLALAKRSTAARGWWMEPDPEGRRAVTDWRLLGADGGLAFLELRPRTGRTHQLRVHLAALGCPILGDRVYGPKDADAPLHLHARRIGLPLYERRDPVDATAPVPPHMTAALAGCGWKGEGL